MVVSVLGQQLLDVHVTVAEGAPRFQGTAFHGHGQLVAADHGAHAAPAAGERVDHHRRAASEGREELDGRVEVGGSTGAGEHRNLPTIGQGPSRDLVAQELEHLRGRTDEDEPGRLAGGGEVGVVGKETVTGVHAVATRLRATRTSWAVSR